jgi:hypothetical protein
MIPPSPMIGQSVASAAAEQNPTLADVPPATDSAIEIGGRDGPEPTRYGDWEKNGRCIDF